jgi:serine/threonine protein kinase
MTHTYPFNGLPQPAQPIRDGSADELDENDEVLPQITSGNVSGEIFSAQALEKQVFASNEQGSDDDDTPLEPGPFNKGDRFDSYRIIADIGHGGYAHVYHAFHEVLEIDMAVKVICRKGNKPLEIAARSKAEARFLISLQNPYVVRVYGAGITDDNFFFIAMELLQGGGTLRSILLKREKLSWRVALPLFAKIAEGVHAAHKMDAIHRDLKPENIYVLRDLTPKVLDFGIAKFTNMPAITTRENVYHGTPPYMSPEQLSGHPVTAQSDIYALGLMLYEALAGKHPMLAGADDWYQDPNVIAYRNIYFRPPKLDVLDPSIYKPIARLVSRLIAKLPKQRPASMEEVAQELRACFDQCNSAKRGIFAAFSGESDPSDAEESQSIIDDNPVPQRQIQPEPPRVEPVLQQQIQPEPPHAKPVELAQRNLPPIGLTKAIDISLRDLRPAATTPRVEARIDQAPARAKALSVPNARFSPSRGSIDQAPAGAKALSVPNTRRVSPRWNQIARWLLLAVGGLLLVLGSAVIAYYLRIASDLAPRTSAVTPLTGPVPLAAKMPTKPTAAAVSNPASTAGVALDTPALAASSQVRTPAKTVTKSVRPADKSDRFVKALEEELKRRQAKTTTTTPTNGNTLLINR